MGTHRRVHAGDHRPLQPGTVTAERRPLIELAVNYYTMKYTFIYARDHGLCVQAGFTYGGHYRFIKVCGRHPQGPTPDVRTLLRFDAAT